MTENVKTQFGIATSTVLVTVKAFSPRFKPYFGSVEVVSSVYTLLDALPNLFTESGCASLWLQVVIVFLSIFAFQRFFD